jgi:hypothetical protein
MIIKKKIYYVMFFQNLIVNRAKVRKIYKEKI